MLDDSVPLNLLAINDVVTGVNICIDEYNEVRKTDCLRAKSPQTFSLY